MALREPNPGQRTRPEPLYDIHPRTGNSIEIFYADRTMETFGWCCAGWFWWPRRRGFPPNSQATGPFATSYSAYRNAMNGPTIRADDARTLGEQNADFHVPNMGYGRADTRCYDVIKPRIR